MKYRDLIHEVERQGWRLDHATGSHRIYKHPTRKGHVTIPGKPNDDVPPGTLVNIRRQARGQ
jgi:predicted RNA binding protein YcfA (HicA-like mRNA interferase family)